MNLRLRLTGSHRPRLIVLLMIALSSLTLSHARAASPDGPASDIAQLFPHRLHAAAGTCFPKYHLELWQDENRAFYDTTLRQSPVAPLDVPACNAAQFDWHKLRQHFRAGITSPDGGWERPRLAVTLEGGGSKAAPFAMGALAGLHEANLLNHVDIISSVSGGGYAAYFYFSRLIDQHRGHADVHAKPVSAWFSDCVPSVHRAHFATGVIANDGFCNPRPSEPKFNVRNTPKIDEETELQHKARIEALNAHYYHNDDIEPFAKAAPFQSHIRFYQDVLYPRGGMRRVGEGFKDGFATWANVGWLTLLQVATVPVHTVMNTAFSMPENTSPSRLAYRAGIERAYGHSAKSWAGASQGRGDPEKVGGEWMERVYSRQYTFDDLRAITGKDVCAGTSETCQVPLWLVNAAGSGGRDLTSWLKTPSNDALRTSFEMSAFGQGSGLFGFSPTPPSLPLRDAVGSSAAFLDRDQRQVGSGWERTLANATLSALNLEWGTDIRNFNVSDERAAWAHVTPLPLYHVSREREREAPTIHLSDGGNTDNLGVLAAIRRGAINIVVVAATGDGKGTLRSLCRAKNHLELDGTYRVEIPDLLDIESVCSAQLGAHEQVVWGDAAITSLVCVKRKDKDNEACACSEASGRKSCTWLPNKKPQRGYDMWAWKNPVVVGRVVRDALDVDTETDTGAGAGTDTIRAEQQTAKTQHIATLLLMKPGIDSEAALKHQFVGREANAPKTLCEISLKTPNEKIAQCGIGHAMPCVALAFAAANDCKAQSASGAAPLRHGTFPQHNVELTTLNSSYTIFGAYFDLARHYASQLAWGTGKEAHVLGLRNRSGVAFKMTPHVVE